VRLCLCGTPAANGPFVHPPNDTWVNTEQRWNDTDRGKPKDSEENLFQCRFVYSKPHIDFPGSEPGPPWEKPAIKRLCFGTADKTLRMRKLWRQCPGINVPWKAGNKIWKAEKFWSFIIRKIDFFGLCPSSKLLNKATKFLKLDYSRHFSVVSVQIWG
jgi:hypothetical protein